jgi:hypothetical protein
MLPKQRVDGSNPFSRSKANAPYVRPAVARAFFVSEAWTICFLSRGFRPESTPTYRGSIDWGSKGKPE